MKNQPNQDQQKAEFLTSIRTSNEFKVLLSDGTLIRNLKACSPDVTRFLDTVQRQFRSDSKDPQEARLQEWAVVRAIGEIRDLLLLVGAAHDTYGEEEPESDDFDD